MVVGYLHGGAGAALLAADAVLAAGARVTGRHELEARGQAQGAAGARDAHEALFQRLAQRFQHGAAELGQFVEEEDAVMRQADLARARRAATPEYARLRARMMRLAQ